MNNNIIIPITLQVIGILVVIAEVILPSGGLLSILAAGLLGYAVYHVFIHVSKDAGMLMIFLDLLLIPILIVIGLKLLVKSPATLKKTLDKKDGVSVQNSDLSLLLHQTGKTLTTLRPSGYARIDGKRINVVSRGEFLEKETEIIVVSISGNQVVVRKR